MQHSNSHWTQKKYVVSMINLSAGSSKKPGHAACVLNESSCSPLDFVHCVDEYPLYYDPINSITHIMLSAALTPRKDFA